MASSLHKCNSLCNSLLHMIGIAIAVQQPSSPPPPNSPGTQSCVCKWLAGHWQEPHRTSCAPRAVCAFPAPQRLQQWWGIRMRRRCDCRASVPELLRLPGAIRRLQRCCPQRGGLSEGGCGIRISTCTTRRCQAPPHGQRGWCALSTPPLCSPFHPSRTVPDSFVLLYTAVRCSNGHSCDYSNVLRCVAC
jgi:hypothetical protein